MKFKVLSVNVKGLNDKRVRSAVFTWIRKEKADIAFLQETFVTAAVEPTWRSEWGGVMKSSLGTNHSRGTIILIRNGLDVVMW